jgi:hypothetical protein
VCSFAEQLNGTKEAVQVIDEVKEELNSTKQVVVRLKAEVGELKA